MPTTPTWPSFKEWLATRYQPMMGAEDPPAEPPADPGDPPSGDPPSNEPPADPPSDPPKPDDDFDKDRALSTIRRQREAEKQLKAELAEAKKAQAKLAEIEREKLSELEQAQLKAQEAEERATKAMEHARDANLRAALAAADIVNPSLAALALKDKVTFTDDGVPEDIDTHVQAFLDENPYMRRTPTADGDPPPPKAPNTNGRDGTGGKATQPPLTAAELEAARKAGMTPERYHAFKNVKSLKDLDKLPK